ncbi:hypothetical protein WKK05_36340 (plasmid) [Nostoc sp. UHCC 0302]|uniref:hypothetical protein n=1 Tax=Nostoc sp. UHCC 0302 TaxID=3134896 RepID=UPI00311CB63B
MDTERDFLFYNPRIATKYNPFYEGEYLIIQTYPREHKLIVEHRSFDYVDAKSHCELENLANDYTSFSLRIFCDSKLWDVNYEGKRASISKQQNWRIAQEYLEAHYDPHTDGEVVVCQCSYPYFSSLTSYINNNGESTTSWQPLTCLVTGKGQDIQTCPNCNTSLVRVNESEDDDFDFDDQVSRPIACIGCANYHGQEYGGNVLVCAIHAHGWDNENCPDFNENI